jgi:hypothetical protein
MLKRRTVQFAVMWALAIPFRCALAQDGPRTGLYQIISGRYTECCGLAGDFTYNLPNQAQSFLRFTVDPQTGLAAMTFLGEDAKSTFSRVPCPPSGSIDFNFNFGFLIAPDRTEFHVDPGPPPYATYWSYVVSNSASTLRMDGTLGIVQSPCADTPTRFSHTNVVAVLIPGPQLSVPEFSTNRSVRLLLQGHAGQTNVIEASTNLVDWFPVSTNVMDYSLCPICPYALFEDFSSTNLPRRFYRAFEIH